MNRLTPYLRDPGDGIDAPCKDTLAAKALYRVDAFEDWIADYERRAFELASRETDVGMREAAAAKCDRKLYAVCGVTLLLHTALALWQQWWIG